MSEPIMSSLPLSALDSSDLAILIDRLSDDQKRFVVQQLLPSILADVRNPRSVTGLDGHLMGYYMPTQSLGGDDLLGASVSDSGSFHLPRTVDAAVAVRRKRRMTQDLFEADLGGSD